MSYMIKWQRWIDPLTQIYLDSKKNKRRDDFEQSDFSDLHEYSGPVAQTPHGLIPINESNLPSTVFNLWRADTNFVITRNIEIIINNELGVEAYDQITPYRFRIAVGKLFDESDVKGRVEKACIKYKNEKIAKETAAPTKQTLAPFSLLQKQFNFFAVVLENNKKVIIHGNSANEMQEKLASYLQKHPESKVEYLSSGGEANATN